MPQVRLGVPPAGSQLPGRTPFPAWVTSRSLLHRLSCLRLASSRTGMSLFTIPLPLPAPASKCRAHSRCSMNVCEFVNARTQLLGGRGGEENAPPALRGQGARMMGASALLGPQPHSGQSRACHGLPSPPTGHSEHAETPPHPCEAWDAANRCLPLRDICGPGGTIHGLHCS